MPGANQASPTTERWYLWPGCHLDAAVLNHPACFIQVEILESRLWDGGQCVGTFCQRIFWVATLVGMSSGQAGVKGQLKLQRSLSRGLRGPCKSLDPRTAIQPCFLAAVRELGIYIFAVMNVGYRLLWEWVWPWLTFFSLGWGPVSREHWELMALGAIAWRVTHLCFREDARFLVVYYFVTCFSIS